MTYVTNNDRPDLGGNVHHGDLYTFAPTLWKFLIDKFAIRSMLDVGCGEGHCTSFFHKHGVIAHGIDGLKDNVDNAVYPIALHDFTVGPYYMPVDFVWSCEVAEHIDEIYVDNYLDTLANGTIVAMTHGLPGQSGYHHVNLQYQEYWIEKMVQRGYKLDELYLEYRKICEKEVAYTYFHTTGLLFYR